MSLVAVGGGKGAVGVTTTATVLAAVWPRAAILADCDPSGGDLALRLRGADGQWLARDMGVVGLAASARMETGRLNVGAQVQTALGGLPVLVGVDSPAQAARIGALWPAIGSALAGLPSTDTIADCGRLLPGLPTEHLLARADVVLLVTRATSESVAHLRHTIDYVLDLDGSPGREIRVVVVADPDTMSRDLEQVQEALASPGQGVPVLGGLPTDSAAAAGLAGVPTRGLDRSALVSSARRLATDLQVLLRGRTDATPDIVVGAPSVRVG
jgi:MinD-like ATPase involved in chromosome partitioning or flagellar assembly